MAEDPCGSEGVEVPAVEVPAGPSRPSRIERLGVAAADRWAPLAASVAAGMLLRGSFSPLNWWWASVLAFALLSWVLVRRETTVAGGFGYGLLFGLAFYVPLLPWVGGLVGPLPWLVLAAMCALFPAAFGSAAVVVRHLAGWPVWFALLWAATEWAKCVIPFGGFPWGAVGYGQTAGPLLPLVALGGVALLSASVVLLGSAGTALAREIVRWLRDSPAAGNAGRPPAVLLPGLCICLVMLTAVMVWPGVHRSGIGAGEDPQITVAAVQGNVPRLGLDFNAQRRQVLDHHVRETLRLAEDVADGLAPQPLFVIWPENASDIDPITNADAAEQITLAAQAIDAPILVGTVRAAPGWTRDNPAASNSVLVWDPRTGPGESHDKRIVQPFGEYLPWRGFFRHLSGYADRAGYFVPGRGNGVVHVAGVPVGVATCWEVIFDRAPRQSVLAGAQMLAVPTNNATFDESMSEQQVAFAKVRAVEHDRYVVIAGTTGISAVIAPDGRELGRTAFFEPAYLDAHLRLKTTLTPATRWAPLVQWVLLGAAVSVLAVAIRQNGSFMRGRFTRCQFKRRPTGAEAENGRYGADE